MRSGHLLLKHFPSAALGLGLWAAAAVANADPAPAASAPEAEATDVAPAPRWAPEGAVQALVHDLSRLVESQEATDWKIDRYEYDAMMPDALRSVCQTTESTRARALDRLGQRIDALGGPVDKAFQERDGDMSAIADLRFTTRVRTLLLIAIRRAPEECPFWVARSPRFRGVQTDAGRFSLSAEGGGLFMLHQALGERASLGGGGSGRLLLGRGLDLDWSVLAGAEVGGAALFSQNEHGEFPVVVTVALPVLLRHHDLTWHYDLEMAPLAYLTTEDARPSWGVRVGGLLGISRPRFRGIQPWFGIGVAMQAALPSAFRPGVRMIQGGLRLGFDWDFSGPVAPP